MPSPVSSLRNCGPAVEAACARAGITSAEEIRALGADETYLRLVRSGTPPHFIGYYALVMGLQGRAWNDCSGAEKQSLRARFDVIKAAATDEGKSRFEQLMNEIGVRQPDAKGQPQG